jgi:outer membrane protein assembly factor BamB
MAFSLPLPGADWPEWRGPSRDGRSMEKNLPEKWSPGGENLLWKAPYGSRSTPVVLGNHVYMVNGTGKGETLQERLLCLDLDTGKLLWEHHWNLYLSDVPPHRIAWSSPAVDTETANVYAFGGNGTLIALSRDGKVVWQRSLVEDYGLFTTHGGRTVSPIVDGGLVIVSAIASTWGAMANRSHRIMAFDKRTGATVYVSTPGGRPYDTSYSNPMITEVSGLRLLITGLGDGSVVAVKPQTGEPVWRFEIAKRGINTAVVMAGKYAIVSHGDENLEGNVMGMIAAVDAGSKGAVTVANAKWANKGFEGGYSSPISDGDRVYQIDNNSNLEAFDAETGRTLYKKSLGANQKASLVQADGKLYVGTESGHVYILKPRGEGVDVLSDVTLPVSQTGLYSAGTPEPVLASAAVAHGRVIFASVDNLYCIGRGTPVAPVVKQAPLPRGEGAVAWVQVRPSEALLRPGQSATFRAFSYDAQGRPLREEVAAWAADRITGSMDGARYTAPAGNAGQAGLIKATVGGVTGEARVRVAPAPEWAEDFEAMPVGAVPGNWISAVAGKFEVQELEGGKVIAKLPNETLFKRMRIFFGPNDLHDYTMEADVRAPERRRQLGDVGVFAQRYGLVLFGNSQRLELLPWQPETSRTVAVPFAWVKDTWYRIKLRVENLPDGRVRALGKAWKKGEAEPAGWLIEKTDPIGNREGSPGLFGDATFGVFYDNLKVTANR